MFRWILIGLAVILSAAASWQLNNGKVDGAVRLFEVVVALFAAVLLEADRWILSVASWWKESQRKMAAAKAAKPAKPAKAVKAAAFKAPRVQTAPGKALAIAAPALPKFSLPS